TLLLTWLPTYALLPSGLIATPCGAAPAGADAGDIGVSVPPAPIPYWETSLEVKFVTYTLPLTAPAALGVNTTQHAVSSARRTPVTRRERNAGHASLTLSAGELTAGTSS